MNGPLRPYPTPIHASGTPFPVVAAAPLPPPPPPRIPVPTLDPTVRVPIVVGPLPASYGPAPAKRPPIVLHENVLVLDPAVFGALTPGRLAELERAGAQRALELLQAHLVAVLRERRGASRGRGRGRGKVSATGLPHTVSPAHTMHVPAALVGGGAASMLAHATGAVQTPLPHMASTMPLPDPSVLGQEGTEELIVVDDSEDEGPAVKKRRTLD
jgi:forkhead box protein K